MYKKNTLKWMKHWDFMLMDCILLQISFVVSYMIRNGWENLYGNFLYRNAAFFMCLLGLGVGVFAENYKGVLRRGYWEEFKKSFSYVLEVTLGAIVYLFICKNSEDYSRFVMGTFPVLAILLIYTGRLALKHWLKNHRGVAAGTKSIMLITHEENSRQLIDDFSVNPYSEFQIAGVALLDVEEGTTGEYKGIEIISGEEKILHYIKENWVDEVLFSIPREHELPNEMIEKCRLMGVTVHVEFDSLNEIYERQFVGKIEGHIVLSSNTKIVTTGQLIIKRMIDIAGGVVGLIITGIIAVFVGPLIFIKSPGPIFFSQTRIGKNGRQFKMYKFRSMYLDAEERKKELMEQNNIKDGMMFKMDDDPRIIKGIGHFIRDYSLDEFPQFWNVLKGDMSLVGTRPPTLDEWEKYDYHHRSRMSIKPGLTGLWQVSGRSEIVNFEEVVRLDNEYIQHWNLGFDIKILLQTVGVVLAKKGSK